MQRDPRSLVWARAADGDLVKFCALPGCPQPIKYADSGKGQRQFCKWPNHQALYYKRKQALERELARLAGALAEANSGSRAARALASERSRLQWLARSYQSEFK